MNAIPNSELHSKTIPLQTYYTGLWLLLAAVVMLFAGLTSALVVRKGLSDDWQPVALPFILYYGTAVLVSSSLLMERVRRQFRLRPAAASLRTGLGPILVLGAGFIAAQLLAWHKLSGEGISLGTNPSSSFYYLLTATYTVSLLGGLASVGYAVVRAKHLASVPQGRAIANVVAIYWHFMAGLWIYLLVLLAVNM